MTTRATPEMRKFAAEWESACGYKSAVMSGIVGDLSHQIKGGYHISRQDQSNDVNYSIVRPDDKLGPDDAAAAVDMTMSTADMKLCTTRLVAAYANVNDPRRKYVNGFNGWLGSGIAQRWDVYARTIMAATPDHKWHIHLECRRKFVTSTLALNAVLSILRGESVAAYLKSIGVVTAPAVLVKAPAYPGRELRRDDKQAKPDLHVKLFQQRMIARGWTSLGSADGFFGAKLESVVKRWQVTIKFSADGVIGPKTWPTPWTRPLGK